MWFAGAHGDVGGGAVGNEVAHSLNRIPLRWMVRECFANNTGILFHSAKLKEIGLSPNTLWPEVKTPVLPTEETTGVAKSGYSLRPDDATVGSGSRCHTQASRTIDGETQPGHLSGAESEDAQDALCRIHDKLSTSKRWWISEILQTHRRYHWGEKSWKPWLT